VYRPRTDEFAEARKSKKSTGKIEQTRLERRLEKLINLHFSEPSEKSKTLQPPPVRQRRSSLFGLDFSELRGKSAGELWKDVINSQAQNGKNDIRGEKLSSVVGYSQADGVVVQLLNRRSLHGKRTPPYHNARFVCELVSL
jgi:hypothetical protein